MHNTPNNFARYTEWCKNYAIRHCDSKGAAMPLPVISLNAISNRANMTSYAVFIEIIRYDTMDYINVRPEADE